MKVKHPAKIEITKKANSTNIVKAKQSAVVPKKNPALPICDGTLSRNVIPSGPCSMDLSLDQSDNLSVSMDESVSTCDSLKSPEVEYIDKSNVADIDSIERKTCDKLHISDHVETGLVYCCILNFLFNFHLLLCLLKYLCTQQIFARGTYWLKWKQVTKLLMWMTSLWIHRCVQPWLAIYTST